MNTPVIGYRELTKAEIDMMNVIKAYGVEIGALVEKMAMEGTIDTRWVAIARTQLQQGFMALTRAVAQPTTF
jgi:hypothetical protein